MPNGTSDPVEQARRAFWEAEQNLSDDHLIAERLDALKSAIRQQAREAALREMRDFCQANGFPFPVRFDHECGEP